MSAHADLCEPFDFDKIPLELPGSKVIILNKPSQRASWDLDGKIALYVGQAPNYYRCVTYFNPVRKQEIISDNLIFIPYTIPIPDANINNFLHQAASAIITLLAQPLPTLSISTYFGNYVENDLYQLASMRKTN